MIREGISFDLLKNINFVTARYQDETKCFSLDNGIALTVIYDNNTRLIKSIQLNTMYIDVTMSNISAINRYYAGARSDVDITVTEPKNRYEDESSDSNGFGHRR